MIEARDAWILPGLIEAHAHIGITEETRGSIDDDCNEISGPIQPQLRAIDAINPMDPAFHDAIRAGITSVMTGPGSANEGCLRGKSQGQLWGFRQMSSYTDGNCGSFAGRTIFSQTISEKEGERSALGGGFSTGGLASGTAPGDSN